MSEFGKDKNSIKQGMTIEQVYDFLSGLGVNGFWVDDNQLTFETCCHNHIGEGSAKLYYYHNTRLFFCYTGCGRFDIFDLLGKMFFLEKQEDITLDDAITLYTQSQSFINLGEYTRTQSNDITIEYEKPKFHFYGKEEYLNLPRVVVNDWVREGISPDTQRKYNVRFNYEMSSIAFPHLDKDNNLLGIRQRITNESLVRRYGKYRPLRRGGELYSTPSSFYLFGLNFNQRNIRRVKKAIVLEGEKSVMKMDSLLSETDNIGVASFGMNFSRHQYEALKELGVEEIIIAFDRQFESLRDEEFQHLLKSFKAIQDRFGSNEDGIRFSYILDESKISGYKDSPADCGREVFTRLYQQRKSFEGIESRYLSLWSKSDLVPEEEWDIYAD